MERRGFIGRAAVAVGAALAAAADRLGVGGVAAPLTPAGAAKHVTNTVPIQGRPEVSKVFEVDFAAIEQQAIADAAAWGEVDKFHVGPLEPVRVSLDAIRVVNNTRHPHWEFRVHRVSPVQDPALSVWVWVIPKSAYRVRYLRASPLAQRGARERALDGVASNVRWKVGAGRPGSAVDSVTLLDASLTEAPYPGSLNALHWALAHARVPDGWEFRYVHFNYASPALRVWVSLVNFETQEEDHSPSPEWLGSLQEDLTQAFSGTNVRVFPQAAHAPRSAP